jgi:CRISPR-associated protein Cas1
MVNEFVYCPRLFYLEWVQGEFEHSEDTIHGLGVHRRVDRDEGGFPSADGVVDDERYVARGLMLSAPKAGLVARIDLLEGVGGAVRPIDYKKGSPGRHGPWEADLVQLCAQGIVLRENGYRCDEGVIYYASTKQRTAVRLDDALIERTLAAVRELRAVAEDTIPPPPLVDSPKCPRCSLVGICLPDEVNLLRGVDQQGVRRLVPGRDDAGPLYVTTQGATVGKNGERLSVRRPGGDDARVRLIDVSHVALFGNVQVTAQALRGLAERGLPLLHFTYGGWLTAVTTGPGGRNVLLRLAQHRSATDDDASLALAKAFVSGKIRNQRTLLRRNHRELPPKALKELTRLVTAAHRVGSRGRLLGIEGAAARIYFSLFAGMLRSNHGFDFRSRARRPAPDPVNALLSFLYSLLAKDCTAACLAVGLDPYVGFFHQTHYGRPSLALDLAEEFRPLIADSVVLTLVNNDMLRPSHFVRRGPACSLSDQGRRIVIEAYEARMQTMIRHPLFGYSVSYRRILEVQARLLSRVVAGELKAYRPFTTR